MFPIEFRGSARRAQPPGNETELNEQTVWQPLKLWAF